MSTTGLETFDSTLQTTHIWLNDLMEDLGWSDPHKAYHALRAVLHTLRDRLPVNEAAHFGAQLPMLVRGIYYEGWHPAGKPLRERTRDEFLAHVGAAFQFDIEADAEEITRAVFRVIARHVTAGQIDNIRGVLPAGIRELWGG